jgi:hypothetical protein
MRPNLRKVNSLFRPDDSGTSNWITVEDVIDFGLSWSTNGNVRRGVAFGVNEYIWEFKRERNRRIVEMRLIGHNDSISFNQRVHKDIVNELRKQTKSNFSIDCIVPLVNEDKEIDHRWGRKDDPKYEYINDINKQSISDFQLLSHSHNQFKRQRCVECSDSNIRFPPENNKQFKIGGLIWEPDVGCSGCPLAQPELYR